MKRMTTQPVVRTSRGCLHAGLVSVASPNESSLPGDVSTGHNMCDGLARPPDRPLLLRLTDADKGRSHSTIHSPRIQNHALHQILSE
jgi:hypothetical protein